MPDPTALASAIAPIAAAAHVLLSLLLVFPAVTAILGARNPGAVRRTAVGLAAVSVSLGAAFWTLALISPDADPTLLHRLWLPLASVAAAAAIAHRATRRRTQRG